MIETRNVKASMVAGRIAGLLQHYEVEAMFSQSLPSALILACEYKGIRQITYRTENAGGAMADAYARLSGKIGIVCAQNGPAATLLVPPLAEAMKASVPVVALVQDVPRNHEERNAFQEIDHLTLFASCTKWAKVLREPSRVDDYLRQAVTAATSGRPGPAALMLPADVLLENVADEPMPDGTELGRWPLDRPQPAQEAIQSAVDLIAGAENPIIVAGGGVHGSGACRELAHIQEAFALPVATTMMGRGTVDDAHPLTIGLIGNVMGTGSSGKHMKELIDKSDLIVLIGTRTNQNGTDSWSLFPSQATIIHLDIDGNEIGRNYPAMRLAGDAKAGLHALGQALGARDLEKRQRSRAALEAGIAAARAATRSDRELAGAGDNAPIRPQAMMQILDERLTADTIVVADASYSSVWVNAYLTSRQPGMRFITPRGLAGLGWGLPMALGGKVAMPDRRVICLAGDGGFAHVWSELETAVREQLPVVVIVLNNGTLGYQKDAEHVKFGRHTGACHFHPVDHAAIAAACGFPAATVTNLGELGSVLDEALSARSPFLIDIQTDPDAYPPLTMFDDALLKARSGSGEPG